jgi:hypothetical protein
MKGSRYDISPARPDQLIWISQEVNINLSAPLRRSRPRIRFVPLKPLRQWLDGIQIQSPEAARKICQTIPSHCPFERTIKLFGHTILYIPPLCKLNPLYEELVALRFRALCYLADECGEDVSLYC